MCVCVCVCVCVREIPSTVAAVVQNRYVVFTRPSPYVLGMYCVNDDIQVQCDVFEVKYNAN